MSVYDPGWVTRHVNSQNRHAYVAAGATSCAKPHVRPPSVDTWTDAMSLPPDQAAPATACVPAVSFSSAAGRTMSDFTATCVTGSAPPNPPSPPPIPPPPRLKTPAHGRCVTPTPPPHLPRGGPVQ